MATLHKQMASEQEELEDFLERVDEVEKIILGLNSSDHNVRENAMQRAEVKAREAGVVKYDRTVINHKAFLDSAPPPPPDYNCLPQPKSQTAGDFMKDVEKDAQERHKRRLENEKEAKVLKECGNSAFRDGNYENAIAIYTKAMSHVKDWTVLYTNRAQAYFKLKNYNEAIKDCDTALKLCENSFKASFIRGESLLQLQKFDDALLWFEKAKSIDHTQAKSLTRSIAIAKESKELLEEENHALLEFNNGNEELNKIDEILNLISNADLDVEAVKLIKENLNKPVNRVFFRQRNGFQLFHGCLRLDDTINGSAITKPQLAAWEMTLDVFSAACTENAENQRRALNSAPFKNGIVVMLLSPPSSAIQLKIHQFLHLLSCEENGINNLVDLMDCNELLQLLMNDFNGPKLIVELRICIMNNLALNERFRLKIQKIFEEILIPTFKRTMTENVQLEGNTLKTFVTLFGYLTATPEYRDKLCNDSDIWDICINLVRTRTCAEETSPDVTNAILGLVLNCSINGFPKFLTSKIRDFLNSLVLLLHSIELRERACSLISRILKYFDGAVKVALDLHLIPTLLQLLQTEDYPLVSHALKALVAMTRISKSAQKEIIRKNLKTLLELLESKQDCTSGNAALCLTHCLLQPRVAEWFTQTNVVDILLNIIRNEQMRLDTRQNCAILLAKLSTSDPRHLHQLRKLRGIEILHACLPPPTTN